ncbi:MAG: endonuclease/exonuclease/phosphatase family protein [Thermoguttaceae bacterium]|jgi:endonuclease/exonuclease/phosphatase family metal-dependent hydrolase
MPPEAESNNDPRGDSNGDSPIFVERKLGQSPRRWLAVLAAAVAVGGLCWHASLPVPLGPAQGTALEGQIPTAAAASRKTIRLGTFNIHGCRGPDERRDPDRVAACLEGLDFVALQEVHGPRAWEKIDQAGDLGQRLAMAWLFAPTSRAWYHLDSGNGLLSRLPVTGWQRIPLAGRRDQGYRNVVLLDLVHAGRTIHVLLTHVMTPKDEQQEQLRAVIDLYLALAEPAVLLGDLNCNAQNPQLRRLLATKGVLDPVGQVLGPSASARIDWIIARGLRCVDAGIRENDASDHPLVWAELEQALD